MTNDKPKKLYDALISSGYKLPDYETFSTGMKDKNKAEKLYNRLTESGYKLPDFDTFYSPFIDQTTQPVEQEMAVEAAPAPTQERQSFRPTYTPATLASIEKDTGVKSMANLWDTINEYANIANRRMYGLPADLGETWAIGSAFMERQLGKVGLGNKEAKATDIWSYKLSQDYRNYLEEVMPVSDERRESFVGQVADGMAQGLTIIGASLLTGGASRAGALIKAAETGTKLTPYTKALSDITSRFGSPAGIIGGSQVAGPMYKEAIESGATEEQALDYSIENFVLSNVFENLPIASMFKRLSKLEPEARILDIIKQGGVGFGEEAITEMMQETYANMSANRIYQANRAMLDGVGEAGAVGGTVGFLLNSMLAAITGRRARVQSPREKEVLDKAIEETEAKIKTVNENNQKIESLKNELENTQVATLNDGAIDYEFIKDKDGNLELTKEGLDLEEAESIEKSLSKKYPNRVFSVKNLTDPNNPDAQANYTVISSPKQKESYSLAGEQITREQAQEAIEKAQSVAELEGLDIQNDQSLMEKLQLKAEELEASKLVPKEFQEEVTAEETTLEAPTISQQAGNEVTVRVAGENVSGTIQVDEGGKVTLETPQGRIYDLEPDTPFTEFVRPVSVSEQGDIEVNGESFTEARIVIEDGQPKALLIKEDGTTKAITNPRVVEEIEYQIALANMEAMSDQDADNLIQKYEQQAETETVTEEGVVEADERTADDRQLQEAIEEIELIEQLALEELEQAETSAKLVEITPKGSKQPKVYLVKKNEDGTYDATLNGRRVKRQEVIDQLGQAYETETRNLVGKLQDQVNKLKQEVEQRIFGKDAEQEEKPVLERVRDDRDQAEARQESTELRTEETAKEKIKPIQDDKGRAAEKSKSDSKLDKTKAKEGSVRKIRELYDKKKPFFKDIKEKFGYPSRATVATVAKDYDNAMAKKKKDRTQREQEFLDFVDKKIATKYIPPANKGKTPLDKRKLKGENAYAASLQPQSVEDLIYQWFLNGGRITSDAIDELFSFTGQGGRKKNVSGEKNARISYIRTKEKGGKTIDEAVQLIYDNLSEQFEDVTDDVIRSAFQDIVKDNNSLSRMAKNLLAERKEKFIKKDLTPMEIRDNVDAEDALREIFTEEELKEATPSDKADALNDYYGELRREYEAWMFDEELLDKYTDGGRLTPLPLRYEVPFQEALEELFTEEELKALTPSEIVSALNKYYDKELSYEYNEAVIEEFLKENLDHKIEDYEWANEMWESMSQEERDLMEEGKLKVDELFAEEESTPIQEQVSEQPLEEISQIDFSKDISLETAKRAYIGISFDSDKRAKSVVDDHVKFMESTLEELNELAITPEQKSVLETEFEKFRQNIISKTNAWLGAKSRTMSPMITGPARFPVERNRKNMETESKRLNELIDAQKKGVKAIKNKINQAASPEQKQAKISEQNQKYLDFVQKEVNDYVNDMIAEKKGIKKVTYIPSLIKNSITAKIKNALKLGLVSEVENMITDANSKLNKVGLSDMYTPKNKVFTAIEEAKKIKETTVERQEEGVAEPSVVFENENVSISIDPSIDRVLVKNPSIPSAEIRSKLKSEGWKWSPQNKAWQRKNTDAAVASAKRIFEKEILKQEVKDNLKDVKDKFTKGGFDQMGIQFDFKKAMEADKPFYDAIVKLVKSYVKLKGLQAAEIYSNIEKVINKKLNPDDRKYLKGIIDEARKEIPKVNVMTETKGLTKDQMVKQGLEEILDAKKKEAENKLQKEREKANERIQRAKDKGKAKLDEFKNIKKTMIDFLKMDLAEIPVSSFTRGEFQKVLTQIDKAATDHTLNQSIDQAYNIFADAAKRQRVVDAIAIVKRAKANIKQGKIGVLEPNSLIDQMLRINPKFIPNNIFPLYQSVVSELGARKTVLGLSEKGEINQLVTQVLNAVDMQENRAMELKDLYESYQDKDKDFGKTINKMLKEELITDEDAELMRLYKDDILDKPETPPTEKDIDDAIEKTMESVDNINVPDGTYSETEKSIIRTFRSITETDLRDLSYDEVLRVGKIIDNLNNGFVPHLAERMRQRIEGYRSAKAVMPILSSYKGSWTNFISSLKASIKNIRNPRATTTLKEKIKRNPIPYIDQILENFKNTDVYDHVFRKLAKGQASYENDVNTYIETVRKAISKLPQGAKKQFDSRAKLMMLAIQREFESNPNQKGVNTAKAFLDATIDDKNSVYSKESKDRLKEIFDQYANSKGELDADKLYKDLSPSEKEAYDTINEMNRDMLRSKAMETSTLIRGNRVPIYENYIHLPLAVIGGKQNPTDVKNLQYGFQQTSTRAGSLTERVGKPHAILFDFFANSTEGAKMTLLDYNMTPSIKEVNNTFSKLYTLAQNDKDVNVVKALDDVYNEIMTNVFGIQMSSNSLGEAIIQEAMKKGYQATLSGVGRASSEFISNAMFAGIYKPTETLNGINVISKHNEVVLSRVVRNIKSAQSNRLYANSGMENKHIDFSKMNVKEVAKISGYDEGVIERMFRALKQNPAYEFVDQLQSFMVSKPDQLIGRPMFFGAFDQQFEAITGKKPNYQKIADNDTQYMEENFEAIEQATNFADDVMVEAVASSNPIDGIVRNQVPPTKNAIYAWFKTFNGYMTRFPTYEYNSAVRAVHSLRNNGMLNSQDAVRLLIALNIRLFSYSLMTGTLVKIAYNLILKSLFDYEPPEEDIDETVGNVLAKESLSALAMLAVNRNIGNVGKIPINLALEMANKKYGEGVTYEGKYDAFDNSIVYPIVPIDIERGQKPLFQSVLENTAGPLSPQVKTMIRTATALDRMMTSKKEETKDKYRHELLTRTPFEIAGNLGYIPAYKDLRAMQLQLMYNNVKQAEKATKNKDIDWSRYQQKK